jgi:pyruvate,water dikinase
MVKPLSARTLVSLDDNAALDPALVGSKTANLAQAIRAGFRVPVGVVVTTAQDRASTSVADEILDRLGHVPLAVRSSATAEDCPDSSYAGQYESYLNVEGGQKLLEAIESCRASLHSDRVSAYSNEESGSAMAVLIQPMIDAVTAGVAFSAHPVSGARDQIVVNAVQGLGDQLVSGEVTPSQWVVDGDQIQGSDGILTPDHILQIAELARAVQAHFRSPQDIEWAIEDDELWLLQARPITSLPEPPIEPIPIEFGIPPGYWEHDASHAPVPNYPIETFVPAMVSAAVRTWASEFGYLFDGIEFCDIGGWTYQRLAPLGGKEGPELPDWLMWMMVRLVPSVRNRLAIAREAVQTDKAGLYIERWYDTWLPELTEAVEELKIVELAGLSDDGLKAHIDTCIRLGTRGIEIHTLLHGSLAIILYELVTTCEGLLGWDMATTLEMVKGTSHKSTEPARRLSELADLARERPEILRAAQLPDDEVIGWLEIIDEDFATVFGLYLDEYGEVALGRSVVEATYAELPSVLIATIANQVVTDFRPDIADEANRRQREQSIATARAELTTNPAGLAEFDRVLERGQKAYPVREDNEFFTFSRPFAQFRYAVLELGERLAARGVIAERNDIMFLHLDEALAALSEGPDLQAEVLMRKGQRAWASANPGPPYYGKETPPPSDLSFLPADTRLPMEAMLWSLDSIMAVEASKTTQDDSSTITGTPASAGTYTGPVRVVKDDSDFPKIRAGDVLVCPITSPVWSVLFPSVGALVTDTGGILSHPAIIAREYGIPAVVATGNATELVQDGQMVTVDGNTGTVQEVTP